MPKLLVVLAMTVVGGGLAVPALADHRAGPPNPLIGPAGQVFTTAPPAGPPGTLVAFAVGCAPAAANTRALVELLPATAPAGSGGANVLASADVAAGGPAPGVGVLTVPAGAAPGAYKLHATCYLDLPGPGGSPPRDERFGERDAVNYEQTPTDFQVIAPSDVLGQSTTQSGGGATPADGAGLGTSAPATAVSGVPSFTG